MQRRILLARAAVLFAAVRLPRSFHPRDARSADGSGARGAVRVSGPSLLGPGCEGSTPNSRIYRNSVVEPHLAIDPRDPCHFVGAWQQDRWSAGGGASGQVSAVSWDGGQTWTRNAAGFTRCQGGTAALGTDFERCTDPWVTIAPDGTVYQMTVAFSAPRLPGSENAMLVSRSTDGGTTWEPPVTLIREYTAEAYNDKNSITADPNDPNYVYAIWHRELPREETKETPFVAPAMLARTTDGGRTWEQARAIYAPAGMAATAHSIVVLPSGELVDVFTLNRVVDGETIYELGVLRSEDKGATWGAPVMIGRMGTVDLVDPYSTFTLRPTPDNIASIAVDRRTGQLFITWTTGQFSDGRRSEIALVRSTDGGLSWSAPVRINLTPGNAHAFVPTIAVLDDGTVGVSYFDLRNNTAAQLGILADHWLAYCAGDVLDPAAWREKHIAGPFDMQRAPYAFGFFIGDYMGLAGAGNSFHLLYTTTTPAYETEITAAYFASVTVG